MILRELFKSKTDILQFVFLLFFTVLTLYSFLSVARYMDETISLQSLYESSPSNNMLPMVCMIFIMNLFILLILANLVYFRHFICDLMILLNMIIIDFFIGMSSILNSDTLKEHLQSHPFFTSINALIGGTLFPVLSVFDVPIDDDVNLDYVTLLLITFIIIIGMYFRSILEDFFHIIFFCFVNLILESIMYYIFIVKQAHTISCITPSYVLLTMVFFTLVLSQFIYGKMELGSYFEGIQKDYETILGLDDFIDTHEFSLLKFNKKNDTIAIILLIGMLIASLKLNILQGLSDIINSFISTDLASIAIDYSAQNFADNAISFSHAYNVFSLLVSCIVVDKLLEVIDEHLPTKNVVVSLTFNTIVGIIPTYFITTYLVKMINYITTNNHLFFAFLVLIFFIVLSPVIGVYTGMSCFFVTLLENSLPIAIPTVLMLPVLYLVGILTLAFVKLLMGRLYYVI